MRLYLVLLPFLLFGQSNLWSWQTTNTTNNMTIQEIDAQLRIKQQQLEAFFKKRNINASKVLTAEQLAIVEQLYKALGVTEAPQNIGKKTFIDYVQDWVQDFISILDIELRTDIKIEVVDIISSLRGKIRKQDFPISKVLWKNLEAEIKKLSSPTTAEGLRGALLNGFNAFNSYMGAKFMLTQHYNKNKATYQKIKTKDLNQQTMVADDFETWLVEILGVSNEKQRELEKEQRELEKEQRELEKEQRELEKEQRELEYAFNTAYGEWLADQRRQIKNIISNDKGTDSTNLMPKTKFIAVLTDESKEWQKLQPELGQEIAQRIVLGLKGDSLEIGDYVDAMSAAYSNIRTPKATVAKHWHSENSFFDISRLIVVLTTGNTKIDKYDIIEEYIQWFGQVGAVVDSLKLSPSRQFIGTKLIEGFESTLTSPELSFFAPKLTENIKAHNKPFLSLQETSTLWRNSIVYFINNSDALPKTQLGTSIDSSWLASLHTKIIGLAGPDTLQQLFKQALRPLPKPDALAKGEAVNLVLELNDGTILTSRILTTIDKEDKMPYTIPNSIELNVSKGRSAYDFVAKPLLSQSPVIRSEKMVTVDFEYVITFSKDRGSSQTGGSTDIERATVISVDKSIEHSRTKGKEKTKTEGSIKGFEGSGSAHASGEVNFGKWLFSAKGKVDASVNIGGHYDWTEETSETTIKSDTKTQGTTIGVGQSVETMEGQSWGKSMSHGNDTGYFTIKGHLTSSKIGTETMVLAIEGIELSSPDMKGFGVNKYTPTTNKTVRWKK